MDVQTNAATVKHVKTNTGRSDAKWARHGERDGRESGFGRPGWTAIYSGIVICQGLGFFSALRGLASKRETGT
jgi:hypothetical protein